MSDLRITWYAGTDGNKITTGGTAGGASMPSETFQTKKDNAMKEPTWSIWAGILTLSMIVGICSYYLGAYDGMNWVNKNFDCRYITK